ncbi:MAG: hypothetical protein AAB360_02915 [Patescibacteria group bacterium]
MTIGAGELIDEYGSQLGVAEALILGEIKGGRFVDEVVTPIFLEAARIRLEALGKLAPEHIRPAGPCSQK